ncbi:hypothetical protein Ddye_032086 [Dipteronia dyeriana]|uniref:RNase H type-1 domain-containing protein n=1 Tax=Dipteronia dyeriana TaxID=168575 RepID=A0AAD9TKI9_9ROSI|nr:hypothetical protein Ddye_032086 [Dipteronia dyeriana]
MLVSANGVCNEEVIRQYFLVEDAEVILNIPLSNSYLKDSLMWHFGKSGMYTVHSGEIRDASCFKCQVGYANGNSRSQESVSFYDYVLACKESMTIADFVLLCHLVAYLVSKKQQPIYGIVSWRPPLVGYFKINTDATLNSSDKILGIGMVIQDSGWRIMACLCGTAGGFYEPQIAEAKAILRGFRLALENGLYPVILESDALLVVNLIKAKEIPSSDVGVVIHDILELVENVGVFSCNFAPRLTNKVAHGLAKITLRSRNEFVWMEDCPLESGFRGNPKLIDSRLR